MPTFRFKHDTTGKGTKPIARRIDDAGEAPEPKEAEHTITGKAHPIAEVPDVAAEGSAQKDSQLSDSATSDEEFVSSEPSKAATPSLLPDSENDLTSVEDNSTAETDVDSPVDGSTSETDVSIADTLVGENEDERASVLTEDGGENVADEKIAGESLPQDFQPMSNVPTLSSAASDELAMGTGPKAELLNELRNELLNELRVELKDELRAELKEELKAELKAKLKADLRNSLKDNLSTDEHSS